MSREIKFRAWDTSDKEKGPYILGPYYLTDSIFNYKKVRELELMQYTGLKDKNGVEIYEGDIVRVCNNNNGFFEVIFINAYVGGWVLKHKEERFLSLGARKTTDIEIIGNIHQNPELS
jgi:uncharacterized phage protein (TIGR01671 family)